MNALDQAISDLTAAVTKETTVEASAVVLLNGIPALIAKAVADATAAGATPTELASLNALGVAIAASSAPLAAAVTANTPPAPPAPPPAP